MNPKEFEAKMRSLPVEEPDEIDQAMLAEAEAMDDGTTVTLEELREELEARFAQINARPPEQMTEEEARSLAEAEAMDDGTTVTLEELREEVIP